jgi:hypothetical protein
MINGDEIEYFITDEGWEHGAYVGPLPETNHLHVIAKSTDGRLIALHKEHIRPAPAKPQFVYVLVYRGENICDFHASTWVSDGAARTYAFDAQLDVIAIVAVEVPAK